MKQKGIEYRRQGALERLRASKFTPKLDKKGKERNETTWTTNKEEQIQTLESRVRGT